MLDFNFLVLSEQVLCCAESGADGDEAAGPGGGVPGGWQGGEGCAPYLEQGRLPSPGPRQRPLHQGRNPGLGCYHPR